jgi:hypothetical protein
MLSEVRAWLQNSAGDPTGSAEGRLLYLEGGFKMPMQKANAMGGMGDLANRGQRFRETPRPRLTIQHTRLQCSL